ncbi:Lysosomal acid glucosylceramidase-like 5 [Homarus americanus]|uniref:Glucosylceramidase n=2 Tax=Homarus americanus TaxID=6706 RepID=A0A8J5JJA0_HOMAM|nr:Lysosomal acid glucosylceramidase-like 5 [Homarus americanus]
MMMKSCHLVLMVLPFLSCYGEGMLAEEQLPCIPRVFDSTSFVCVCNVSYCDTLPSPTLPASGEYLVYTSDLASRRFFQTKSTLTVSLDGVLGEAEVEYVLDSTTTYQKVMGWGGAFTDAAASTILSLSQPAQDHLLGSYFSSSGIEYNLGRVNMGGCDFSWRTYTYCDTPGDVSLETFALQPEDIEFKIPIIKRAEAMVDEPLKLFASPWTAPPWMKTNNDYVGYGQLLPEMYQPWANYFVKFLDSYGKEGVNFWGLTAQNEPLDGYLPGFGFNCMGWTAEQQRLWVAENLGPTLQAHGYDEVILMILDDQRFELPRWAKKIRDPTLYQLIHTTATPSNTSEQTFVRSEVVSHRQLPETSQQLCVITGHCAVLKGPVDIGIKLGLDYLARVLNDTTAAQYVDGIAIHWYGDNFSPASLLEETHDLFPDFFILGTEACEGDGLLDASVVLGSWERLEHYAHDILITRTFDSNALGEDTGKVVERAGWDYACRVRKRMISRVGDKRLPRGLGGFSDHRVEVYKITLREMDEFYKNPMFYALGHFSKFIKEGAVRVSLTSPDSQKLDAAAFTNPDGSHVVVILNRSNGEKKVAVRIDDRGTMSLTVGPRSLHTAVFQ